MNTVDDASRKVMHPFKGGLSLILTSLASLIVAVQNFARITGPDGIRAGSLVFAVAATALIIVCGSLWLAKYYLPWRREAKRS